LDFILISFFHLAVQSQNDSFLTFGFTDMLHSQPSFVGQVSRLMIGHFKELLPKALLLAYSIT
jgi:hypothetical protein